MNSKDKSSYYENLVNKIKEKLNVYRDDEIIKVVDEMNERKNKDKMKENVKILFLFSCLKNYRRFIKSSILVQTQMMSEIFGGG